MVAPKRIEPSRADRKSKKRKLEEAIPDLPGDEDAQKASSIAHKPTTEKPGKKRKRSNEEGETREDLGFGEKRLKSTKKAKKQMQEGVIEQAVKIGDDTTKNPQKSKKEVAIGEASAALDEADNTVEAPKKLKKERKAERKVREAANEASNTGRDGPVDSNESAEVKTNTSDAPASREERRRKNNRNREKKRKVKLENGVESKPPRFIAFIGNLPYSATAASLQTHFASVKPKTVRNPTEKDNPQKSKGYAFIEFEGYDHMKTCLKLFHHSMFDDGISPPRKINVELTGGGGGNSKDRKDKIHDKNQKLNEERARRMQEEEKAKITKSGASINENSIHPSRRPRVQGA